LKIAMVTAFWGPAYPTGSGVYAYQLSRRLAEMGHDVHVYTSQIGNFNGNLYPPNLHLHPLRTYGMMWDMNPIANVFPRLLDERFDVVHVHSYIFYMSNLAALARAVRNFGYVLNFHGGLNHKVMNDGSYSRRIWIKENIFDRTIGRLTVKLADKVLTVSRSDIPLIQDCFGVIPEYIPNAVCTEDFSYCQNDSRTVTYVGKLEKWKGLEELIGVFKIVHDQMDDVRFRVVGNGSLSEKLKRSNLPLDIVGYVPHLNMPKVYGESAVTILPSYMEGSPTVCMESLSCGTPCVATNVGDTPEIVMDGKCGYLANPGDVNTFAERIIGLLQDSGLRKRMGAAGREHVMRNFSYESVVEKMLHVYDSVAR